MHTDYIVAGLLALALAAAPALADTADHREFDAQVHTPFRAPGDAAARDFTLHLSYPDGGRVHPVWWRLELSGPGGVRHWQGRERLGAAPRTLLRHWDGRLGGRPAPAGLYRLRLRAGPGAAPPAAPRRTAGRARPAAALAAPSAGSATAAAAAADAIVEQSWELLVGAPPAVALAPFAALPTARGAAPAPATPAPPGAPAALPAPSGLDYTVYLGNLHSQSKHSDGGAALDHCGGAQEPQSAAFGPRDAYDFARRHGLDFLMTSEHNHMYDGSDGTNASADPLAARGLYQGGLAEAARYNAEHPEFLAIYGMEWGVIAKGGHLNILNSEQLLGWERNGAGQLLADTFSAKGDYAALYGLMREHGWIGQFNHPGAGQFRVAGRPLGYSADGDAAMVLCEVLNSNAFSRVVDESEPRRSTYEKSCNAALEAGFHLAFSSNQDNHCANWGAAYTNRTGVLIPKGTALSSASLLDALRARRVFATMDKQSQLVLLANGHVMGERFANSGPLTLSVRYANSEGRGVAALSVFEGVPGRNGVVALLGSAADSTVTPAPGPHFYYAKVTQDDGRSLWSAPVWVEQRADDGARR
ncbi:CehA/McbA family metallohydrolase [Rugamonas sp. DEMB1]|uniref:CehA/McbA family metallohydrolase n=1 Tax=Rugamonas sp. DEMB1 TaxID=3039386 RepID=UPI0024490638|nr:CehA/McbA family metallohydrolase [Rugamonas sp. DEMB1]WGG48402.1 CehA/McbA family metallohydrolase [Rugamonas sp. DEMB1]